MARNRSFIHRELDGSIVFLVKAICCDYNRREVIIRRGDASAAVMQRCIEINSSIEAALDDVEPAIKKDLLNDICYGRGYDASPISAFLAKNTYYRRKHKAIYDIAHNLNLI